MFVFQKIIIIWSDQQGKIIVKQAGNAINFLLILKLSTLTPTHLPSVRITFLIGLNIMPTPYIQQQKSIQLSDQKKILIIEFQN